MRFNVVFQDLEEFFDETFAFECGEQSAIDVDGCLGFFECAGQ